MTFSGQSLRESDPHGCPGGVCGLISQKWRSAGGPLGRLSALQTGVSGERPAGVPQLRRMGNASPGSDRLVPGTGASVRGGVRRSEVGVSPELGHPRPLLGQLLQQTSTDVGREVRRVLKGRSPGPRRGQGLRPPQAPQSPLCDGSPLPVDARPAWAGQPRPEVSLVLSVPPCAR